MSERIDSAQFYRIAYDIAKDFDDIYDLRLHCINTWLGFKVAKQLFGNRVAEEAVDGVLLDNRTVYMAYPNTYFEIIRNLSTIAEVKDWLETMANNKE